MKFKNKSKILTSLILLNSIFINSSAGVLSDDTRYETFNKNNITINDILEEDNVDVKIYGNTVNNIIAENNKVTIKGCVADYPSYYIDVNVPLKYPLRANTEYTISLNVKSNGYNQPPFYCIMLGQGDVDTGHGLDDWSYRLYWDRDFKFNDNAQNLGKYQVKFTTPSRIEETSYDHIKFIAHNWHNFDSVIEDIAIYEGDQLNKIPFEYKNEIESSFENNLITQEMVNSGKEKVENLGKYKVEVKSTGKNLFDGEYLEGYSIDSAGGISVEDDRCGNVTKNFIPIEEGETYSISNLVNRANTIAYYDKDYKFVKRIFQSTITVPTGLGIKYMKVKYDVNAGAELMVNRGSILSPYEPYKETISTFYLNEPLRGLPNGVSDRIINKDGNWVVERNCGEITFNGSEDWRLHTLVPVAQNTFVSYLSGDFNYLSIGETRNSSGYMVSSHFPMLSAHSFDELDTPSITTGSTDMYSYIVRIDRNKLATADINGFKQWLSNNPLNVVYKLEEAKYESIGVSSTVGLYLGTTYISNNSNVSANMEIVVDRAPNRAKEAVELAKNHPTIENLDKARYWTNLLRESILKDGFQNEVNNITNIEDLIIEKKTASVNSDIYIKPKNILSLSLDTNSIVFDEVDATEDAELKNAVNLSVKSSLPYKVNAYLEGEIYNSDKTEVLDKSALNIKASNADKYKIFADSSSPITLLDDQDAGMNNIHSIDLKLVFNTTPKVDTYKTTIKFEAEQK